MFSVVLLWWLWSRVVRMLNGMVMSMVMRSDMMLRGMVICVLRSSFLLIDVLDSSDVLRFLWKMLLI